VAAVSALTRVPAARLAQPGHARQLLVAAARELGGLSATALARRLGVSRSTVHRELPVHSELLGLVARVLDDPRFPALGTQRLDHTPRWREYMQAQPARRRRKDWLFA
jgi:DNA-binding IclR family transcriptional regulator